MIDFKKEPWKKNEKAFFKKIGELLEDNTRLNFYVDEQGVSFIVSGPAKQFHPITNNYLTDNSKSCMRIMVSDIVFFTEEEMVSKFKEVEANIENGNS